MKENHENKLRLYNYFWIILVAILILFCYTLYFKGAIDIERNICFLLHENPSRTHQHEIIPFMYTFNF